MGCRDVCVPRGEVHQGVVCRDVLTFGGEGYGGVGVSGRPYSRRGGVTEGMVCRDVYRTSGSRV